MSTSIRNLILTIATLLFSVTLFDVMYGFKNAINPGISQIYNLLGPKIAPNMVTLVVFDWRGYDTLGEALILVTAVVIVLLVFGRGKIEDTKKSTEKTDLKEYNVSPILKIFAFPVAFIIICLGVLTILGGHITPGGGFQGGAMIASGIILCIIVYGVELTPIKFSHKFILGIESIGALGYVILGLIGLFLSGFFLYNIGADFYNIIPQVIVNIFHYPDPTNAGIVPYLNIFVGLKVLVGLSTVVIAFSEFKK